MDKKAMAELLGCEEPVPAELEALADLYLEVAPRPSSVRAAFLAGVLVQIVERQEAFFHYEETLRIVRDLAAVHNPIDGSSTCVFCGEHFDCADRDYPWMEPVNHPERCIWRRARLLVGDSEERTRRKGSDGLGGEIERLRERVAELERQNARLGEELDDTQMGELESDGEVRRLRAALSWLQDDYEKQGRAWVFESNLRKHEIELEKRE